MKIREALDKVVVWGKANTFAAGILVGAIGQPIIKWVLFG